MLRGEDFEDRTGIPVSAAVKNITGLQVHSHDSTTPGGFGGPLTVRMPPHSINHRQQNRSPTLCDRDPVLILITVAEQADLGRLVAQSAPLLFC